MPKPSPLRPRAAAASDPTAHRAPVTTPTPSGNETSLESVAPPGRKRTFTAADKLRIVREAAACTERGAIGALLRREGIYSSLLARWRAQFERRGGEGLAARTPGRKPTRDAKDRLLLEADKRVAKLEAKLALAEKLIALQKKASEILGIALTNNAEG